MTIRSNGATNAAGLAGHQGPVTDGGDEQLLGAIDVIIDAYLGHLGVDDLLRDITRRLGELLDVDTAAVLLREGDGSFLVARAAYGIEQEVRQGVRIPLGKGFAGTIAELGCPMVLDQIDASTVENQILWESGIRAMLGVPLVDGDSVIGVLHVGSKRPRTFTPEETRSLQFVAERLAAAVRNRGMEMERATAQVLQRSLLPSRLPDCPGVEFATRYVPAETGGVGGDWYDAFRLPNGLLWVMVGDVAGHGLMPAVIMGRLRSAIRAYALAGHRPEYVLALADRKLQFFEPGFIATALVAVLSPPYAQARIASAGHVPPVMAAPGEGTTVVRLDVAPPLGAGTGDQFESTALAVPPGAVLVAYTDGLVERRGLPLDAGIELLRASVRAENPESVCRDVMHALIGEHVPEDDVAVVAIRRQCPD